MAVNALPLEGRTRWAMMVKLAAMAIDQESIVSTLSMKALKIVISIRR
jgi:hypothetical protein